MGAGSLEVKGVARILEITWSAAEAIRSVLAAVTPGDASMRNSSASRDGIRWELTVDAAARPGDQVVRGRGVEVLVDRGAVAMLEDKVLDAHVEAGRVQFSVQPRDELGSSGAPGRDAAGIAGAGDRDPTSGG
jgi:Fe-S cluster assembly iron-binding protein IscA